VLRTVVLTQYRRVTDGQTDGIAVAIADYSTALAERRAVKRSFKDQHNFHIFPQLCDEPHVTSAILFGYLRVIDPTQGSKTKEQKLADP